MALNVYRSEERIHFAGDGPPTDYFGWYLSYSGESESVHPFKDAAQLESFRAAVMAAAPAHVERDGYDAETLPALVCVEEFGDEYQRESNARADHYPMEPDAEDRLMEAVQAWTEANM